MVRLFKTALTNSADETPSSLEQKGLDLRGPEQVDDFLMREKPSMRTNRRCT